MGPVANATCSTNLRAGIYQAWCDLVGDPGRKIIPWLVHGAPAGIARPVPDTGIFPNKHDEATLTVEQLYRMQLGEDNYRSLTDDVDADELVYDMIDPDKGWIKTFTSLAAVRKYLGRDPVVSQLGLVVKHTRDDKGNIIATKKRIILDCKRSGANACSVAAQRIILPRPFDAVDDALKLLRANACRQPPDPSRKVEHVIADFVDAYWSIPLHVD